MSNRRKHILIISGPMGSGHVKAAEAIAKWAKKEYPSDKYKITNINSADLMWQFYRRFYERFYNFLVNYLPLGWAMIYHRNDDPEQSHLGQSFRAAVRRFTVRKLPKVVQRLAPDYIICTHFLPAEILNYEKAKDRLDVPVASVVTDFSLNRIYVQSQLEHFFVASRELKFRLELEGIEPAKVHVTGIPVLPEFEQEFSKKQIKALKDELGLPQKKMIVMLMMGGESKGKLEKLTRHLLERYPDDAFLVMLGKNKQVLEKLEELQPDYPQSLFPVGYTTEVWKYLAASNLVISKPGGISTSECLMMRKPMIIMYPIPGQEERNADYLLERNVVAKAYDEPSLYYKDIMLRSERLEYMIQQIEKVRKPNAAMNILKTVVGPPE